MKGNITNRKSTDSKKRWLWYVAIIVVAIIVILLMMHKCTPADTKPKGEDMMPTIHFNSDDGYTSPKDNSGAKIEATSGFVMDAGTKTQGVKFSNSKDNHCAFIITLYLADGTKIYTSDYLYPGESIRSIELMQTLKKGLYKNALMVYELYSTTEPHDSISRCEFPIEIQTK